MSRNIPVNFLKNSEKCHKKFWGMSPNVLGNFLKNFGEYLQTFHEMSSDIPRNVNKHSRECCQIFQGLSSNITVNVSVTQEMKMQGQSKISSCYFCVWCKSRGLEGRGSLKFPCVIPNLESFSPDLLRAIISYWEESHLDSGQTFTMERFCKNSQRL